jgi:hypothetical protein
MGIRHYLLRHQNTSKKLQDRLKGFYFCVASGILAIDGKHHMVSSSWFIQK